MVSLVSISCHNEIVSGRSGLCAEAKRRTLRTEFVAGVQGDSRDVESAWLQAGDSHRRLMDRDRSKHIAVQVDCVLQRALLLRLLRQCPVDDGSISFDAREVDGGCGRDVEAEECGELVEGLV